MKSKSARLVRRNHARYHQGRDDLNIVPMIDMMVIWVFFLIVTAGFSRGRLRRAVTIICGIQRATLLFDAPRRISLLASSTLRAAG